MPDGYWHAQRSRSPALRSLARIPGQGSDLAALWSVPQALDRRDGRVVLRRLDGKGRLILPLTLTDQPGRPHRPSPPVRC